MKNAYIALQFTLVAMSCVMTLAQDNSQKIAIERKSELKPVKPISELFPYQPIRSWVGKRFIFLPTPKESESGTYEDFNGLVTHKNYSGRIARVVSVNDSGSSAHIEFEMEDNGERLRVFTVAHKESVRGIALLDDIVNARKQWAGKTLWSRTQIITCYDERSGELTIKQVKKYGPLKVVDVKPGWDEEKPARFVLETSDGQRGFVDLNLSGTNVQKEARYQNRFEEYFLFENPRLKYNWGDEIWSAIEKGQIYKGMTGEQVKMSWGDPEKITRTADGELWTYTDAALIFKQGVMIGSR